MYSRPEVKLPTATVIVAAFNEEANIDHVMDTALGSQATIELIVADGGSTDSTVEKIRARATVDARVRLIHNPDIHQSAGLNRAASAASGHLLVRLDGHTRYSETYISSSIAAWRPGTAVGGPMLAEGANRWSRATASAMADPLAIGPGRFHHATEVEQVDTVYLGTFSRTDFLEVGGYRTFPSGTVEDTDFYERWRRTGRSVTVDPSIRSWYRARNTWAALVNQYLRYGRGKAELLWVNGRLPSHRPIAPAILVAAVAITAAMGIAGTWIPALALGFAWIAVLAIVAIRASTLGGLVAAAAATMHLAYGLGTWWGIIVGRPRPQRLGLGGGPQTREGAQHS